MRAAIGRLAHNSLIYGTGQVLTRFISLLLLPVFTSYLTPADYGVSSILGVITYFLTPLFALGIATALGLVYFEGSDRAHKDATVWTAVAVLTLSGLGLIGLGALFGASLGDFLFPAGTQGYNYPLLVLIVLATAALGIMSQPLMVYLQLEEKVTTFVALTVSSTLITIGLSVVMVVGLRRGIQGMLEASLIAQTITLALALLLVVGRVRFRLSARLGGKLLRLGIPLVPAFVFVFVMLQVNKYMIQMDLGLPAVGIYTIGFNLGFFLTLFVGGFTNAWYPFFMSYQHRQDDAKPLFGRVFTYYVLGFGALSLMFYMAARPAVMILTQEAFHEAYVAVGPSATVQFLIGVHSILLVGMYFARQVQYQAVVQAIAAAASLVLNVILIALLGILGAAVALALGFLVMVVLQHIWNVRRHYLAIEYDWGRLGYFALVYVAYAVLFIWPRDLPLAAEIVMSGAGTLLLSVLLFGMLAPGERTLLRSTFGRFLPARFGHPQ